MIVQSPLNVVLDLLPDQVGACAEMLTEMKRDPAANAIFPFGQLHNIHFGRFVLLPAANRQTGLTFGPKLVLATNYDGAREPHLREIIAVGGAGLVTLLTTCAGFSASADPDATYRFLQAHQRKVNAFYVNTVGRGVEQVVLEGKLHAGLQRRLDATDWSEYSTEGVYRELVEFVRGDPELAAALQPADEPSKLWRLLGYARIGALALIALGLALLFWPVTLALVLILRSHEVLNRPDNRRPQDAHINGLERDEDHGVHNHLSAVGVMQKGWLRNGLLRAALFLLDLGSAYLFNRGKLAEIDTIHFARWVVVDRSARLYFFSNFDGSPESYQDDFIERVAFGLNLVFSNGVGWPRTRYLLFGGASDEQSLKAYYRDHQIPTGVWFAAPAYRSLTAVNMANNAAIRKGLSADLSGAELTEWLQRF